MKKPTAAVLPPKTAPRIPRNDVARNLEAKLARPINDAALREAYRTRILAFAKRQFSSWRERLDLEISLMARAAASTLDIENRPGMPPLPGIGRAPFN